MMAFTATMPPSRPGSRFCQQSFSIEVQREAFCFRRNSMNSMKMFTVSLLTLAFALGTSSQEAKHAPVTNLDGTFWAVMDATSKAAYVLGFTAGYFKGYVHATVDSKGPEGARATESINKAFLGGPA